MKKRNRGFTLVEMLIVVAVIAVLTAVAIPAYRSSLEKSKSAVCVANRRSLQDVLTSAYLLENVTQSEIDAVSLDAGNNYQYEGGSYPCPSGGTITAHFENGSVTVRCSFHDDGKTDGAGNKWTNDSAGKIWDVVSQYGAGIDSGAVDGKKRNELLQALKDAGVDIESMGVAAWKYQSDSFGTYFQWTTSDVSNMTPGAEITVIRYRLGQGEYEGAYSVWKGKVGSSGGINTVETYSGKADEYTGKLSQEEKKDIENVLSYYNEHCGSAPKLP